jgi:glycerol dehydrogenase
LVTLIYKPFKTNVIMITTTLFPGRYVQGPGAIKELGKEIERFGKKGFVIADPFVYDEILPDLKKALKEKADFDLERFEGECTDKEIERLSGIIKDSDADVVVGFGGGKAIDTAKAVAHELKLPMIIIPSLASTDAPCSALSVIYTEKGEVDRYLFLPQNPNVVIVDTSIIAKAPVRFLVAGMGDALATWFEARSCMQSYAANMTGNHGSMTAFNLASLCFETLLEYGFTAKVSCEAGVTAPALEKVVEANTLLSGLGFESGGLATAHAIHNGLTVLEPTHDYFHGEKVTIGTLASLFLTDQSPELIDTVYNFCQEVGLPITLEQIGLKDASDDDLMKVAKAATKEEETSHNEPMPVTAQSVFNALKMADEYGKRFA